MKLLVTCVALATSSLPDALEMMIDVHGVQLRRRSHNDNVVDLDESRMAFLGIPLTDPAEMKDIVGKKDFLNKVVAEDPIQYDRLEMRGLTRQVNIYKNDLSLLPNGQLPVNVEEIGQIVDPYTSTATVSYGFRHSKLLVTDVENKNINIEKLSIGDMILRITTTNTDAAKQTYLNTNSQANDLANALAWLLEKTTPSSEYITLDLVQWDSKLIEAEYLYAWDVYYNAADTARMNSFKPLSSLANCLFPAAASRVRDDLIWNEVLGVGWIRQEAAKKI